MGNYYQRFVECVAKWPDKVAVEVQHSSGTEDSYTYAELRRMSDTVANWINVSGARGDRCIILATNGPRWLAVFMGTLASGCIAVPLDTAFNSDQVRKLAVDSGATLLFTDQKHASVAEAAVEDMHVRIVLIDASDPHSLLEESLKGANATDAATPLAVNTQPGDTAAILYSSGTTGDPKGVTLTHQNLHAETDAILRAFELGPSDSILGILPLFHALALVIDLLLPLAAGARIVFLDSLNTADLMRALPRVNIFICVPQFFYLIHDRLWKEVRARGVVAEKAFRAMLRVSRFGRMFGVNVGKVFFGKIHKLMGENMRILGSGGSKLDAEIGREFEDLGFMMLQGYGLTETTGCAMYTPPGRVDIATIGIPLPGMEVKIVSADASGSLSAGSEGEICIRGGIVMKGYWNRPDATAAVLDADGWLHTGDLGYMDKRGFVRITGRAKDIIITSSGKNIYPDEIEKHYSQTPFIKEICVLGLESAAGEPFGERLHAAVVPNFDLMREKKIVNARELLRYEIENLSTKLPSQKRILSYDIWQEDLPRTTTRKIKRFEVERRVREEQVHRSRTDPGSEFAAHRKLTMEDEHWLADPDVQRAVAVIRSASKVEKREIHPDDNLELDLGLDSMERVELLVALEREFGAHIEESAISQIYSVRELVEAVQTARAAGATATERPAWDAVLQQEPDDPDVLNVAEPHTIATQLVYLLTRFVHLIARDLFHLRVEGLENLPANGPFIIAPNHQSYLDGPILMSAIPWRTFQRVFYVGTSDIFGQGLWRRIARALKLIPVDPDANLVPAMRAGAFGLRRGNILVLFPEGERSIDGAPRTFKKGAAILATHLNTPIVPVALDGFYEVWPRNRKFNFSRRTPLRVRFGEPVLPQLKGNPEAAYDNVTREVRNRVSEMWDELHAELYPAELTALQS